MMFIKITRFFILSRRLCLPTKQAAKCGSFHVVLRLVHFLSLKFQLMLSAVDSDTIVSCCVVHFRLLRKKRVMASSNLHLWLAACLCFGNCYYMPRYKWEMMLIRALVEKQQKTSKSYAYIKKSISNICTGHK